MNIEMDEETKSICRKIIHSHAAAAAAGNAVPVPGLGLAVDILTMTTMTGSLCYSLGGSITDEAAKSLAVVTLKETMINQPIKTVAKEISKFVPFLGSIIAPSISLAMLEATGWAIANKLYLQHKINLKGISGSENLLKS